MSQGRITRGKTRPGRLRLLDRWLVQSGELDGEAPPLVVDVGLGARPDTTVELFERLRGLRCDVEVLGTDLDPERVATAAGVARPGLRFATMGFDLTLERPARVIRAMNVLRQYKPEHVASAHERMASGLAPGGVLLEGTCAPSGEVLGCLVLRRTPRGLFREALVLAVSGGQGFAPLMLRDRLPRDIRDRGNPGHPVGDFLARWTDVWRETRDATGSPAAALVASARGLARRGEPLDLALVEEGVVVWRPPEGVAERQIGDRS